MVPVLSPEQVRQVCRCVQQQAALHLRTMSLADIMRVIDQAIARLLDPTDPARQPAAFAPERATPYFGYGYQFWLHPLKSRSFAMQGVHGQSVYVQPESGIVMVQTAVYAGASGALDPLAYAERSAFWMGVLQSLGGLTSRH